jgi:hypothetical protein|tara:strand:+ start:79 stop:327 length:249 start_codon:yes stop_codon:yes gene_type:complete
MINIKENIKVTKKEVFDVSSEHLNAIISEDFYKQNPDKPFCMTVNANDTREQVYFDFFETKDDALDCFITLKNEVKVPFSIH